MLIESRTISAEEVEIYKSSKYQVITIIPSERDPTMNIYICDQEELDRFGKSYSKHGEFIISVTQVEASA
jgi:hypothetical protein